MDWLQIKINLNLKKKEICSKLSDNKLNKWGVFLLKNNGSIWQSNEGSQTEFQCNNINFSSANYRYNNKASTIQNNFHLSKSLNMSNIPISFNKEKLFPIEERNI